MDAAVRDLSVFITICDAPSDPRHRLARELLVGLHARRAEYEDAVKHANVLLSSLTGGGTQAESVETTHATRAAHLTSLDAKGAKDAKDVLQANASAAGLYGQVLHQPKPAPKPALLIHYGAACLSLGRTRRRDALQAFLTATEIVKAELLERSAGEGEGGGGGGGGATKAAAGDAGTGCQLDRDQLWILRYLLGLSLQQDGSSQSAIETALGPALADVDAKLPQSARIAMLTAFGVCQLQLGQRENAMESCEAAVRLGAKNEAVFTKALLHAQEGQSDEAMATLRKLLKETPNHLGGLLGLSTLFAEQGHVMSAIGQASAARELSNQPLALQQLGQLRMRLGLEHNSPEEITAAMLDLTRVIDGHKLSGSGKVPPQACDAHVGLALALTSRHEYESALHELKQGMKVDSLSPLPLLFRGHVLLRAADAYGASAAPDAEGNHNEKSSPARMVGDLLVSRLPREAAASFEAAVKAFALRLPEAHEDCFDTALKKAYFPAKPGGGRITKMHAKGAADAPAVQSLSTLLQSAQRRDDALAIAHSVHQVAVSAHRQRQDASALVNYDFACRLAERVASVARGSNQEVRAEVLSALAHMNRGKLQWAMSTVDAAVASFAAAAKAFERSRPLIPDDATTLTGLVQGGGTSANYNMGAALEAMTLTSQMIESQIATTSALGAAAGTVTASKEMAMRVAKQRAAATSAAGGKSAEQCFALALRDQPHGGSLLGRSAAMCRNKPREALAQLSHPVLAHLTATTINRAVIMHDLGEDLDGAQKELQRAVHARPDSVYAAFNFAQLRILRGEWCEPLACLLQLGEMSPAVIESASAAIDETAASERAVIASQLGPLLTACRKWQTCLETAAADIRSSATLVQPHISFTTPLSDSCFASPAHLAGGASANGVARSQVSGVPLSAPQLALLESLLSEASKPPPTAADPGASLSEAGTAGFAAPTSTLPAAMASGLTRVLSLQIEGKMHQAERQLEALLRPLTPPATHPLGPAGALLYLWRSRSRRAVGRRVEADADLRVALAHVGVDSPEAPPEALAQTLAQQDRQAAADAARAAITALSTDRSDAAQAAEAASADASADAAAAAAAAASAAAAAAAGVALPRASWWACGLLLEEGSVHEEGGESDEALKRYLGPCIPRFKPVTLAATEHSHRRALLSGARSPPASHSCELLAAAARDRRGKRCSAARAHEAGHAGSLGDVHPGGGVDCDGEEDGGRGGSSRSRR